MMDITPAVSTEITEIRRTGNALFMRAARGVLRLQPMTKESVRASLAQGATDEEAFSRDALLADGPDGGQGCLLKNASYEEWTHEVTDDEVKLFLPDCVIAVSRRNGSIRAEGDGIRFRTAKRDPFSLEAFDFYRTSPDSEIRTEQIRTPDGVKSRIVGRETEYDETLYRTRVNLDFEEGEHIVGLGQGTDGLHDFRGTTQFLHQANRKIAIPFFLSSAGYGFLSTTEGPAVFSDTENGSYFRTEADEFLDFVLILGRTPKNIIRELRRITGKAAMLPKWAFGYVQSVERYETQEEILKTAAEFEKREIPLDLIVLDWMSWPDGLWGQKTFDPSRFPDPTEMTDTLHRGHVHFMMSIWPNMTAAGENYKEMKENGCILPGTEIYDAFSEKGRKLYSGQLQALARHGVDAWWCDSSEPMTPEWSRQVEPAADDMYHEYMEECAKCMPLKKANAYGRYHAEGMQEGLLAEDPAHRVVNLTRNGYVGSQQHGTILWSGDTSASWDTLKKQIEAGLHFVMSGHPYWTLDIGAFFVKHAAQWFWNGDYPEGIQDPKYRELYVRWFEYGAFLPVFRAHGTDVRREPWAFELPGDPCYDALKKTIALRYRLLPYIYSLAGGCFTDDGNMMAMLCTEFPEDPRAWTAKEQFMFGPSLMVCPVTKTGDSGLFTDATRSVYFPEGADWYDFATMERHAGGTEAEITSPIDRIPVFVRAGSVIPVQEPKLHTEDQAGEDISLLIYPGADGEFALYEDAGDGCGHESGEFARTVLRHREGSKEVEIRTTGSESFRRGKLIPVFLKERGGE